MAQFQQWFNQDFTEDIEIRHCESVMFTGDDQGAVVGVYLFNNGTAYSGGGAVTGAVKRSDGGRVVLTGTLSGNAASVVIPAAALAYAGPIGVQIILTVGNQKTTILKAVYNVDDTSGAAVDPGDLVPDIDELLAEIETMQQATAAANTAAANADLARENIQSDLAKKANGSIIDQTNLFEGKQLLPGYYSTSHVDSDLYVYAIIPVTSGTSYTMRGVRWLATDGVLKQTYTMDQLQQVQTYTPDFTGNMYASIRLQYIGIAFLCETAQYSNGVGTLGTPLFNPGVLAQNIDGDSTKIPLAQSAVSSLFPVDPMNIIGAAVVGGTAIPPQEIYENGYWTKSSQDLPYWNESTSYNAILIPAGPGPYTSNTDMRFIVTTDENDNVLDYVSSNTTYINCSAGTKKMYISVSKATFDDFRIGFGVAAPTDTMYTWAGSQAEYIANRLYGPGFATVTGDLSSGSQLLVPRTNCKKNNVYAFKCDITSFSGLQIGHGDATYDSSYIVIDATNVTVHNYTTADSSQTYAHGLTISGYLFALITVKAGTADIEIYSNGGKYAITDAAWAGDANGNTYARSVGSTLTNCVLTWSSGDFRKPVWLYGDSYLGMLSNARWVYYLMQHGYGDNVMLNAYPGESSAEAIVALKNGVGSYGKPQQIIWCMGMNDGSDTDVNTPSTAWATGMRGLLGICEAYGITPILATVPTVPTINHEGKNKWVRESGYRYIDFAKAVGAQSNGTWRTGMLGSDGVHPTENGALALFYQAMIDAPEITFSNP